MIVPFTEIENKVGESVSGRAGFVGTCTVQSHRALCSEGPHDWLKELLLLLLLVILNEKLHTLILH